MLEKISIVEFDEKKYLKLGESIVSVRDFSKSLDRVQEEIARLAEERAREEFPSATHYLETRRGCAASLGRSYMNVHLNYFLIP